MMEVSFRWAMFSVTRSGNASGLCDHCVCKSVSDLSCGVMHWESWVCGVAIPPMLVNFWLPPVVDRVSLLTSFPKMNFLG